MLLIKATKFKLDKNSFYNKEKKKKNKQQQLKFN